MGSTVKGILIYVGVVLLVFGLCYPFHEYLLKTELRFSLLEVYLFHVIFSLLIYTMVEVLFQLMPTSIGYLFLAGIMIKMGFFLLIFKDSILSSEKLIMPEKLGLIVPLFLFLVLETIFISKKLSLERDS